MKITGFEHDGETIVGAVAEDGSVRGLAEIAAFWRDPAAAVAAASRGDVTGKVGELRERPAVPGNARVICIGLNYRLHAQEANLPIPTVPVVFARWTRSLSVDGDPAPQIEEKFDWEVELGIVIGRRQFKVSPEQATNGIFGYVAFNDLSARSYQMQTSQWTMGKNSDASGPMSAIVTRDEVGDPAAGLRLTTRVNGEIVQDSTTADMIFTVEQIVSHLSQVMTLYPGDLIITGTPAGVGLASGRFLKPGDEVEIEVEKIGKVRTPIIAAPSPLV